MKQRTITVGQYDLMLLLEVAKQADLEFLEGQSAMGRQKKDLFKEVVERIESSIQMQEEQTK